jgi:hypothetical protein
MSSSTTSTNMIPRGDFTSLDLNDWQHEMIESGFKAVSSVDGGWEFLSTYEPSDGGFQYARHPPKMEEINTAIDKFYGGHSGGTYGDTMRLLQFIAKEGWDAYVTMVGVKRKNPNPQNANVIKAKKQIAELEERIRTLEAENKALLEREMTRPSVMEQARAVDTIAGRIPANALESPLAFAEALQQDPVARRLIPDIDQQADAMKRFSRGELSYAEMRSLCG